MASVLTRCLHKILANRLKSVQLDQRQRAFRESDGCADNITMLDILLEHLRKKARSMYMVVLDVAKAFDSRCSGGGYDISRPPQSP